MKDWKKKSKKVLSSYQKDLPANVYEAAQRNLDDILRREEITSDLEFHCSTNIFPHIALYQALKAQDPATAYQQVSELFWNKQVKPGAVWMRRFMKIPGIHKLVPRMAANSVKKRYQISPEGFQHEFLETSDTCFKVNIYQCPYYSFCLKYGVPELCDIFCTSDEMIGEAMEPNIQFLRSQTIGRGGEYCDFTYRINPELQDKRKR